VQGSENRKRDGFKPSARLGDVPPANRRILWFLPIGLAAAVLWHFIPTTEATITKQLEEISEDSSFIGKPCSLGQIQRLVDTHFASNLALELGDQAETTYARSEIVEGYFRYCSGISQLKLDLSHLVIQPSLDRERATVTGELAVNLRFSKNEQRTEPRRFVVTLKQQGKHWFIVHAKVSASRIDQPEARP
jgi:hypothetical protein